MFLWGLITGTFIGGLLGVILMCMLYYSRSGDERGDDSEELKQHKSVK